MLSIEQFEEMDSNLNGFKRRTKINVSEELLDCLSVLTKKINGVDLKELSPEKKTAYFLFLAESFLAKDIPHYKNKSSQVLSLKWEKKDQEEKERKETRRRNLEAQGIYEDDEITDLDLYRAGHIPDTDTEEEMAEYFKNYPK